MSLAALAKRMADAGAPMDAIIMALEAVEAEQSRIAEGREKAAERKRRQRSKGRDDGVTVTGQSQDGHEDSPLSLPPNEKISNPPTYTPENITPARKGNRAKPHGPAKPDGVSDQTWIDFVHHRKAKRAPVSETAMANIRREAAIAGWSLEAAIAETVARGWQSFKAEFVAPKSHGSAGPAPGSFLASLGSGP